MIIEVILAIVLIEIVWAFIIFMGWMFSGVKPKVSEYFLWNKMKFRKWRKKESEIKNHGIFCSECNDLRLDKLNDERRRKRE